MAQWRFQFLTFTSSLVIRSLYEIPRCLQKHLISNACILLSMSAVVLWSTFHMHVKYGHGQGTHQSDLGADGDVLVILFPLNSR